MVLTYREKLLALAVAATIVSLTACLGQESPPPPEPIPSTTSPAATPAPVRTPIAGPTGGATATLARTPTQTSGQGTPVSGTPSPTPLPLGSLIAFEDLQRAWSSRGITVTSGGTPSGFTGFSLQPVEARLTKGSDSMAVSVLRYASREALFQEWDTASPQIVAPKGSRRVPAHVSIWWNENVVIVVRERSGNTLSSEALQAFLTLSR